MEEYEPYADLEVKEQMQRELNHLVANRLIENAARVGRCYQMAVLSAVTGRWDDVWKDVRRGRITPGQAQTVVDSLLGARLISPMVAVSHREYIAQLARAALDKPEEM